MKKAIKFQDVSLRDGTQSLWAMRFGWGGFDQVVDEMDRAGYEWLDAPINSVNFKMWVRFFQENPWDIADLFKERFKQTDLMGPVFDRIDLLGDASVRAVVRSFHRTLVESVGFKRMYMMANARNEWERYYPWVVPMVRDMGLEFSPCICYYPAERTTDEYYAKLTKHLVETYKPDRIWLKDAGGLLSLDRIRTLLPTIQKEATGIPIELHTHGMSTYQGLVVVEAMKLGVDGVHTCVPPLASGSSHISIFNAMHNAKVLGLEHNITDVGALEIVEERLNRIAKIDGLPVGAPLEYDHGVYSHQVPGGVISNLKSQLEQLGIADKLDEVLDEVVQIIEDMGHPIMITPGSQFIVSQAAVNVATGERYKEVLDSMIEMALGVWGWEDAGVPWMNQDVRDRFLNHPNAKRLEEKYEHSKEAGQTEGSVEKLRESYGMKNASDRDFWLHHIMNGDTEIKKIKPARSYYTGKEPLQLLLKELSKDHSVRRLSMKKGDQVFEFRQH